MRRGTRARASAGSGTGFTPSTSEKLVWKAKLKANCGVGLETGFLRASSQMTAFPFLYTKPPLVFLSVKEKHHSECAIVRFERKNFSK